MKQFFFLCIFLVSLTATAQKFEISGKLVDKENGAPLESATIFVERPADSTLVTYTITDKEGNFVLEGSDNSEALRLVASYAGYIPFNQSVKLTPGKINLGVLQLEFATNLLGEVTVVADRAPVTVKTDTLEFNAASFNTRQDANLEEVMKKLPGVEVDAQGNITVNGKPVSRILVNGKEFFGNDPKIATKNLPKEIIDKIQVVDTKTKEEEFTGKAGDPDNKTINITIKEDKNHGYFARATVGGGTDDRYEMSGIGNYFNNDLRVSVLASSNNINSSGFSFDEVFDAMGGRGVRSISRSSNGSFGINGMNFGGGNGITKSETAGFNFTNDWNKKVEVNADYFFGRNDTETRSISERENFLPNRTYYSNTSSSGNVQNDSHRASASVEVEIDSLTKISFRPRVNINDGFSTNQRMEETFDENRDLTNSSTTLSNGTFNSTNISNNVNFIKRFGSRGAYIQADFSNENNRSENDNLFVSERITYQDDVENVQGQNQLIDEEDKSDEYSFGITQRSVLAENLFLDLSYDFSTENSENTRNVYGIDEQGEHTLFLDDLSNAFEVKSLKHIPNLGVSYEGKKLRAGVDAGLLNTSLETVNMFSGEGFDRSFNNLYLRSNIRYEIKRGTSANISYRNNTEIPSIRQLQPVADVTNPLNIVVGNPDLKPTFTHNISLNFHDFDFATRSGFGSYASLSITEDEVVPVTTTSEDLVRTTTYTNLDGGFSGYLGAYYNKRYKTENSEFSYRLGGNANYRRQVGFTNEVRYDANRLGVGPSVGFGYNYKELIDINPRYSMDYVFSDFGVGNNREEEYINHTFGVEATTYWPKNIVFGNDFTYNYFGNVAAAGFDPTAVLWNMSLGYQFLKDNATVKVKVYDLLNENVSTSRVTGQDYVQDTQELILEQYFMLSFTYKLSKFGGKDPNQGGRRMMRF